MKWILNAPIGDFGLQPVGGVRVIAKPVTKGPLKGGGKTLLREYSERTKTDGSCVLEIASIDGVVWGIYVTGHSLLAQIPDPGAGKTVNLHDWLKVPGDTITQSQADFLQLKIAELKQQLDEIAENSNPTGGSTYQQLEAEKNSLNIAAGTTHIDLICEDTVDGEHYTDNYVCMPPVTTAMSKSIIIHVEQGWHYGLIRQGDQEGDPEVVIHGSNNSDEVWLSAVYAKNRWDIFVQMSPDGGGPD